MTRDENERKRSVGFAMNHSGEQERWNHFSQSREYTEMYNGGQVCAVLVEEDAQGDHVAWWDTEQQRFTRLDWQEMMIRVCFPYPLALYESKGEGMLLRVRVSRLAENVCGCTWEAPGSDCDVGYVLFKHAWELHLCMVGPGFFDLERGEQEQLWDECERAIGQYAAHMGVPVPGKEGKGR